MGLEKGFSIVSIIVSIAAFSAHSAAAQEVSNGLSNNAITNNGIPNNGISNTGIANTEIPFGKILDPCTKLLVDIIPPPKDTPKALDSVKDRDPELYNQIQAKVSDPRYIGELGNVTISTHDKDGNVNGCVFIQNVPYWESGPAAQALIEVNKELSKVGKKLETDPLNGAGRTLGQEEAIAWRNSGVHAKVGKSNHGFGNAIDFKDDPDPKVKVQIYDDPFVNATLHAHGWRQGDSRGPIKNDFHHWSFVGPGPAKDGTQAE